MTDYEGKGYVKEGPGDDSIDVRRRYVEDDKEEDSSDVRIKNVMEKPGKPTEIDVRTSRRVQEGIRPMWDVDTWRTV